MEIGDVFDKLGSVLLYTTIALIGGMILLGALVWFLKREKFADFKKYAGGIAIGYAIVVIVALGYVKGLDTEYMGEGRSLLFVPIISEIAVVFAGIIAMLVCSIFSKKAFKIAGIVTGAGALGGFVAIMVQMAKYFKTVEADYDANTTGLIVAAIVIMAVIAGFYALGNKRDISDTRSIVYGAIAIALSFALSYIRFFKMPQGGSVTFASLLPLMVYCCMFGTRRGLIVCMIYGALQAVQDPWIIHPMQFLLDYPLAFGLIGVSGIFVEKGVAKKYPVVGFVLGAVLGASLRFASHVCSGVFAFASWADTVTYGSVAVYSLAYNSFTFVDMAIAIAAGVLLFSSRAFLTQMALSSDKPAAGQVVLNDEPDEFEAMLESGKGELPADSSEEDVLHDPEQEPELEEIPSQKAPEQEPELQETTLQEVPAEEAAAKESDVTPNEQ